MSLLETLGGSAGAMRLSQAFYSRVGQNTVLRPLFPGKSLRCATEEMAAFLVQFLDGPEEDTQKRWWLSLAESHARFQISAEQRAAWLTEMEAALSAVDLPEAARQKLCSFFAVAARYVTTGEAGQLQDPELSQRWHRQCALDAAVASTKNGADAAQIIADFSDRPSLVVGLCARLMRRGNATDINAILSALDEQPTLATARFAGRLLLHSAAGAGQVTIVRRLLATQTADVPDHGGHTSLYIVANACADASGPEVVRELVGRGADINRQTGVTRAAPLHMAARRGHSGVAKALLDLGANPNLRDAKGVSPLQRALNLRRFETAEIIRLAGGFA